MFDDDVTVPAGWYPDPMGLPQLRWWNNHAWTELTTEAKPPLIMQQPTALLYADDDEDLPTRRQQREEREQRERDEQYVRLATEDSDEATTDVAAFAEPQLEIDPIDEEPVSVRSIVDDGTVESGESAAEGYTPRSAASAVSAPAARAPRLEDDPVSGRRAATIARLPAYTAPVWIIALIPMLQLVVSLLLLLGFSSGLSPFITGAVWLLPYLLVIGLAAGDSALLKRVGYDKPAHWAWAFLGAPVYLIARSASISRTGTLGLAPLLVWVGLGLLQLGSVLVVPGLVISALPQVFASEAENSISSDASVIGANLEVSCPAPAVLIGQQFACLASTSDGESYDVTVSLERVNGWIDWRVDDWGIYSLDR
ncbi:hypothetical protein BH09ACT3_BH09ACT3_10410 [soil metagenome]